MTTKLLYAPTIYQWDTDRTTAPETWYYRWQRRLWEHLAARSDVRVVWKAGRGGHCEDPARRWRAGNIRYSTAPIGAELRRADAVFVDTVSNSVILDASRAGVPVLCCYTRTDRRVVLPIVQDSLLNMFYCETDDEVFGWLGRLISGELPVRLLEPSRSDWLGELARDL